MILDIEGARASWENNKLHIAFDVIPEGFDHLDLKTGEIFQSSRSAALHKQEDKAISATLFVARREQSAAGAELPSQMQYVPGRGERGSSLRLTWRLPDDHVTGLQALVLAGRMPRTAVIFFADNDGELEYGWEPDGSGQKWDNEKNPSIPIENVRFDFSLQVPSSELSVNTEVPEGDDRAFFSDTASVNFAMLRRLSSIEASLGRLSWTIGLIALLIVGLVLLRFWR